MKHLLKYLKYSDINDNQYWFEVRDPKDGKKRELNVWELI